MGLTIWNKDGNDLLSIHGYFTDISTRRTSKSVVHGLPSADKDVIQKLGVSNRRFIIKGFATHFYGSDWVDALPNTTGSIYFTSSAMGATIDHIQVYFYDVDFGDIGGRSLERKFVIRAIEVI